MLSTRCVAFLCLSLAALAGTGAADFFTKCHRKDSDCLKNSANQAKDYVLNGIKELGIPSFTPLKMKDVDGSTDELTMQFKNLEVTTLDQIKITSVERFEQKLKVVLEGPITVVGHYLAKGTAFSFPVEGDGDMKINSDKILIEVVATLTLKDGHYKITGFDYKYEPLEKIHIDLQNLSNGDIVKAEELQKFLKENGNLVVEVLGGKIIRQMITHVVNDGANKLISNFPAEDLELD